ILRTTFPEVDGVPYQHIQDEIQASCVVHQSTGGQRVQDWIQAQVHAEFDLQKGPLARLCIGELGPEDHLIAVAVHHIVLDDWSIQLLVQQAFLAYFAGPTAAGLRETSGRSRRIQFIDYAAWEGQQEVEDEIAQGLEEWSEQFLPLAPALEFLPLQDRHESDLLDTQQYAFQLSDQAVTSVRSLALELGATPFVVLLGLTSGVIATSGLQKKFTIGTTVANRDREELQDVVGPLVNLLPIPLEIRDQDTWTSYLHGCKQHFLKALKFQHIPFELLVERSKPERDASRHPLFSLMINMQADLSKFELPGLRLEPLEVVGNESFLDASLAFSDNEQEIRGVWQFRPSVVEQEMVEHLTHKLDATLRSLAEGKNRGLQLDSPSPTSMLEQQETMRKGISLGSFAARATNFPTGVPADESVWQRFSACVSRLPQSNALEFEGTSWTYQELAERASQCADWLAEAGVQAGDRVVLHVPRSSDSIVLFLALWKVGGVAVPIDPTLHDFRKQQFVDLVHPQWCVGESENSFLNAIGCVARAKLEVQDTSLADDQFTRRQLSRLTWGSPNNEPATPLFRTKQLAYVLFTSGSTGQPKAVAVTQRSLLNLVESLNRRLDLASPNRFLWLTSLSFDISFFEWLSPLFAGGTVIIAPAGAEGNHASLKDFVERSKPTAMQATPTSWEMLFQTGWKPQPNQTLLCGGEPLSFLLAKKLTESSRAWNVYGPTETTIWSSCAPLAEGMQVITLGHPICNTQLYVLDPQLELRDSFSLGELHIGGTGVAAGYLNDPAKTAGAFLPDPFAEIPGSRMYRSGDQVCSDHTGALRYFGRKDGQVKLRGHRIELGEIESRLKELPELKAAAVVRWPNRPTGQLLGYVVPQTKTWPSATVLKLQLRKVLPSVMVPSRFFVVDELPRTAGGKLDREAVRKLRSIPLLEQTASDEPADTNLFRTETEVKIGEVWGRLLAHPVSRRTDFFDVGGDSFLVVKMLDQLEKTLNCKVQLAQVMRHSVLQDLAEFIDGCSSDESTLVKLNKSTEGVPIVCLPPAGGSILCYASLASQLKQPLFAMHNETIDPETVDAASLLSHYEQAMVRGLEPQQPIILLGWSLGGILAAKLAEKFSLNNAFDVRQLVLLDVPSVESVAAVASSDGLLVEAFVHEYLSSLSLPANQVAHWCSRNRGEKLEMLDLWKKLKSDFPKAPRFSFEEFQAIWKKFASNLKAVGDFEIELDPNLALFVDASREPKRSMLRHAVAKTTPAFEWIDADHYSILREDLLDLICILEHRKVLQ
ncbi:MAG: amino acid adenylation domain-containing protein, partial [Planctomycetales bacterium]|nr:amino acid adenylation domain-containing protein [Planctomycetales bacterium]